MLAANCCMQRGTSQPRSRQAQTRFSQVPRGTRRLPGLQIKPAAGSAAAAVAGAPKTFGRRGSQGRAQEEGDDKVGAVGEAGHVAAICPWTRIQMSCQQMGRSRLCVCQRKVLGTP